MAGASLPTCSAAQTPAAMTISAARSVLAWGMAREVSPRGLTLSTHHDGAMQAPDCGAAEIDRETLRQRLAVPPADGVMHRLAVHLG